MKVTVKACLEIVSSGAADLPFVSERSSFIVSIILRQGQLIAEEYERQRRILAGKHVKKDPQDGNLLTDAARNYIFTSPEAEDRFKEGVKDLMDVEVELSVPQLRLSDLRFAHSESNGIRPRDLYALVPFVHPEDVVALMGNEQPAEAQGLPVPQGLPQ